MPFEPRRIRIRYSLDHWTPFVREVFDQVLRRLRHRLSQVLYLVLYDRVWHSRDGQIVATPTDMARWIGADQRTINRSLCELIRLGFIEPVLLGRSRSRTEKPCWSVPQAKLDFRTEGPWTPVPRFFIHEYARRYPKSLLLVFLIWHQHICWRNDCWPGIARLTNLTAWSSRSVYEALNTMGHEHRWQKLRLGLPWPLEIWTNRDNRGNQRRHFHVRAVFYERKKGRGRSAVMITKEFAQFFHVRTGKDFTDRDHGSN